VSLQAVGNLWRFANLRLMRIVAAYACCLTSMFLEVHLRKVFWSGRKLVMAYSAELS